MVRQNSLSTNWSVVITAYVISGRNPGSTNIAAPRDMSAFDAFDYAIHARGYFRIAIETMGVSSITIDVIEGTRAVECIEITRDQA